MKLEQVPTIGKATPANDGVDAPFWVGLNAGELRFQRCRACADWQWPAVWRCPDCGGWELDWCLIPAKGSVYSWTRTWQAFSPAMKSVLPYVTVLVELPHAGGRRLLGVLVDDEEGLAIGAPVEGIIQAAGPINFDQAILRWRLTPGARRRIA